MHRLRTVVLSGAVAALVLTAFAAPVAAGSHKTKLAIVNGIPGKKIDVCVNGKEVKSGLRYGKRIFKATGTSKANVKFFARDARKCKGKLLGKKTVFPADATVVVTKKKPRKVMVFDNSGLGTLGIASDHFYSGALRYAGDVGAVGVVMGIDGISPIPLIPAVDEDWVKGDQTTWTDILTVPKVASMWVTKPHTSFAYLGPDFQFLTPGSRYEWIIVGSNDNNVRVVKFKRPVTITP